MLKFILATVFVFGVDTAVHFSYPINVFSFNLLENLHAHQENFGNENIAVSPISAFNIFSLLTEGASGATFNELIQVLNLPEEIAATQALHSASDRLLKQRDKDVLLEKQSAIFAEQSLQFHRDFCDSAKTYSTDVFTVDATNTTKLADDINYYICLATEGLIKNTVKPDMLENLRLLLVDAIYFKANWSNTFDPTDTRVETFYDQQGRSIGNVNMMYQKGPNKISTDDEIEAELLEMPYGKERTHSMIIFLPYDGVPLKRVLNNLSKDRLYKWLDALTRNKQNNSIECRVPRFKVQCQVDLIQPLKYMGLYSIFDDKKSELPGISDSPLYVSKTVQKVDIEVTEKGTVAAAATVVGLENRILGPSININRPFVYTIMNRQHNVVLFAGIYSDPSVV